LDYGLHSRVREALGTNSGSSAYRTGVYASFAIGAGRLAYAGIEFKGLAYCPSALKAGTQLEKGLQMGKLRNELKNVFRLGLDKESRMYSGQQLIDKYSRRMGTNDPDQIGQAIADAATRTNIYINAAGAYLAGGAGIQLVNSAIPQK